MQHQTERVRTSSNTRQSPRRRNQQGRTSKLRRLGPAARQLEIAAPATLTLPVISSVPTTLVYQKTLHSVSSASLSLLDLGMAREEDADLATPSLFIEQAFKRWIKEKTTHLKNVRPHFTFTDSLKTFGETHPEENEPIYTVGISYSYDEAPTYCLKDKIEALETAAPGLGETALYELYNWLHKVMFGFSPDFLRDHVQQMYWYGEEDEQSIKEAAAEMQEVDIEEVELFIGVDEFETEYPKWVCCPSEKLKRSALKKLSKNPNSPLVAEVVKHLLSAPNMENWCEKAWPTFLSDLNSDNECVGYGAMLCWDSSNTDLLFRIHDDFMEYCYQGNVTDLYALYLTEQSKDGLQSLFDRLESYITVLTWVDQAIGLLIGPLP